MRTLPYFADRNERVRRDRLALALQLEPPLLADLDHGTDETQRLGADQDLPRLRRLLQPRRDVDRVPGRKPLLSPGHDLACVDADPAGKTELGKRITHLSRGSARSERVVLVRDRHAENRHYGVADELLHRAAMRLHDPLHALEIAGQQRAQSLRVCRLAEFR